MQSKAARKSVSLFFLWLIIFQIIQPTMMYALTSGPDQPEVHGFEPAGVSDMVDLFSGDFNYNLPLLDVGGYPVNISYHSGAGMDEEASWVGLGWNLNPGTVSREMRGIPDDFNGQDQILQTYNVKPNKTWGIGGRLGTEILGFPMTPSASAGVFYNNYKGFGTEFGVTASSKLTMNSGGSFTAGINFNSQNGTDVNIEGSLHQFSNNIDKAFSAGGGINSRQGLKDFSFTSSRSLIKNYNLANRDKTVELEESSLSSKGTTFGFSYPTFYSSMDFPLVNENFSCRITLGSAIVGDHFNMGFDGYYSNQYLQYHSRTKPVYGTLYLNEQPIGNENYGSDISRENDMPTNKFSKFIAMPIGNYDVFNVQGQGVSGQFKIDRLDVGSFGLESQKDNSYGASVGAEFGVGNISHNGANLEVSYSKTEQGKWTNGNLSTLPFKSNAGLNQYAAFRNISETSPSPLYNTSTSSRQLTGINEASNIYNDGTMESSLIKNRLCKGTVMSYLTAKDASVYGLDKMILSYPFNSKYCSDCDGISSPLIQRIDRTTKPLHHISELTVTSTDGSRYVYGIPAYNLSQIDVSFRIPQNSAHPQYFTYSDAENSIYNTEGKDNLYSRNQYPAYAHSYLLSGVLSPDYSDLTGDGISDDDIGSAVKFTYSKLDYTFKWRTPLGDHQANYQEGLYADDKDQVANYSYGTKEVWYLHGIESKTMVAFFIVSDRRDAVGVLGENGGIDTTQKLKKLDRIELYSKSDIQSYGANAVPIKVVHFVYDYSSCPGVPNNIDGEGKLTLKEIYFTFGNNNGGRLNGYKFDYNQHYVDGSGTHDFSYDQSKVDKWGNYNVNPSSYLGREVFPYTFQDTIQRQFCSAWALDNITLPSGGKIHVDYESDDYAYVENNQAGQMFFIKGFGDGTDISDVPTISTSDLYLDKNHFNDFVYFDLKYPVSSKEELYQRYLSNLKNKLYFTCRVAMPNQVGEFVSGYADIQDYGLVTGSSTIGYIQLKNVSIDGNHYQPILLSALQKLRYQLPDLAYNHTNSNPTSILQGFKDLIVEMTSIGAKFRDFNQNSIHDGKCKKVLCGTNSWIRLGNPYFKKFGGGSRVKRITINDNFSSTGYGDDFSYGQEYDYTIKDSMLGTISSGVASWEPPYGADELLRKQPVNITEEALCAPDKSYYVETPIGNQLFPAATVGYSHVVVSNLKHHEVKRTGTGYTVTEFYTAKDFPTFSTNTTISSGTTLKKFKTPSILTNLLHISTINFLTISQGFKVEVNDMHGKPKSKAVYDENGQLISKTKYHYKVVDENALTKQLDNNVSLVKADGTIYEGQMGMNMDVWTDERSQKTRSGSIGIAGNLEFFLAVIPILVPTTWPNFSCDDVEFHSTATTKYVYRHGINDWIEKFENGSTVRTTNLLYDDETGMLVLSQTSNEFNDPIYTLNLPAHWAYDGMGMAYKNLGGIFNCNLGTNGEISLSNPEDYFVPGDELMIKWGGFTLNGRYYVVHTGGSYRVIDETGEPVHHNGVQLEIIRSGRRNLASSTMGSMVSLKYPPYSSGSFTSTNVADLLNPNIVQASATMYSDQWFTRCIEVPKSLYKNIKCIDPQDINAFFIQLVLSGYALSAPSSHVTLAQIWSAAPHYMSATSIAHMQAAGFNPTDEYSTTATISSFDAIHALTANIGTTTMQLNTSYGGCGTCPDYSTICCSSSWIHASTVQDALDDGYINYSYSSGSGDCDAGRLEYSDAYINIQIDESKIDTETCESNLVGKVLNPYRLGILGNWRPKRNYVFYDGRTSTSGNSNTDVRTNGSLTNIQPFWVYDSGTEFFKPDTSGNLWTWNATISRYDEKGNETENVDPIGRYSSALFGYNLSLAVATAANAKEREIAVDNFEDYSFSQRCHSMCGYPQRFGFKESINGSTVKLSKEVSHTGKYSLLVTADDSATMFRDIYYSNDSAMTIDTNGLYNANQTVCTNIFSPDSGKYLLSAWVKEDTTCNCPTYLDNSIRVSFAGSSTTYSFHPAGPIIDGWQRYECTFYVPGSASGIYISLKAGDRDVYWDDIRIHPWTGIMKTYVYDPNSLRLMATLDENNYAKFYEYDDQGNLIRVKRETENGVITIQENRTILSPQ